jgi:hypothetical protein
MEATVSRLNPRYIGFLLIRYSPDVLSTVFVVGTPRRVDLPRLIKLTQTRNNPAPATEYAMIRTASDGPHNDMNPVPDRRSSTQSAYPDIFPG